LSAVSEAVKTALSKDSLTEVMRQHAVEDGTSSEAQLAGQSQADPSSSDSVTTVVNDHVSNLTGQVQEMIHCFWIPTMFNLNNFTSVSVNLSSWVGSKK